MLVAAQLSGLRPPARVREQHAWPCSAQGPWLDAAAPCGRLFSHYKGTYSHLNTRAGCATPVASELKRLPGFGLSTHRVIQVHASSSGRQSRGDSSSQRRPRSPEDSSRHNERRFSSSSSSSSSSRTAHSANRSDDRPPLKRHPLTRPPRVGELMHGDEPSLRGSRTLAPSRRNDQRDQSKPSIIKSKVTGDKGSFFSGLSFKQLGLRSEVVDALKELGVTRPSHIQAEALATFLRHPASRQQHQQQQHRRHSQDQHHGQHLILADQAGSGKTLAYLLPIFHTLKEEEAAAAAAGHGGAAAAADGADAGRAARAPPLAVPSCPRAVIVAPTTELVQQVHRVVRAVSRAGDARLRCAAMTGGQEEAADRARSWRTQVEMLRGGLDVVVATPGRLLEHVSRGSLSLQHCRVLVMDEVDVLMGDTAAFTDQVSPLRQAAPHHTRFLLVTATLPEHTLTVIRQAFPGLELARGPGLHRTAAGLVEELVDCSGGEEVSVEAGIQRKLEALVKLVRRHASPRTLVFCNKIESCRAVENHLKRLGRRLFMSAKEEAEEKQAAAEAAELGVPVQRQAPDRPLPQVLPYHEALREDLRQGSLDTFLTPPESATAWSQGEGEEEAPVILVATDRMSRGIDCPYCDHVVLFDFPRDPSEYVRRVGRTARGATGRGVVSVLVLGKQFDLAQTIMERNKRGQPVHRVPELA